MSALVNIPISKKKHKSKKALKRKRDKVFADANINKNGSHDYQISSKITPTKSEWKIEPITLPENISITNFNESFADYVESETLNFSENTLRISSSDDEIDFQANQHKSILEEFIDEHDGDIEIEVISPKIKKQKVAKKTKTSIKLQEKLFDVELVNESESNPKKRKIDEDEIIVENDNPENDTSKNISKSTAQFYYSHDGTIVVLEKDDTIYFHGLFLLTVFHGEVEVLGYTINKNSKPFKLYSPRGTSLLYIKNKTKSNLKVSNHLRNLQVMRPAQLTEYCAVFLCQKWQDNVLFIEKHISQQIFPKNDKLNLPRVVFDVHENWNLIDIPETWNSLLNDIKNTSNVLVCGGKGVGKSTFLRYSINTLLTRFSKVRIIDLDPGQPEFTIPGCVSISTIDKPVFGVNYTHLRTPEKAILCDIAINYEPEKYMQCVKVLLENEQSIEIPTLINYMGYTHGFGINILSSIIAFICPSDVVEITSKDRKKNFKLNITPEVVKEHASLFASFSELDVNFNFHKIESRTDKNDGWSAQSRQLREMCVLAYFSKVITANSIFSKDIPMYKINIDDLVICDLNSSKIHLAAVNANLVALCTLKSDVFSTIFICFGWGIVRGIDVNSNSLVLMSVEKPEILEKVTHLVLGSVTLPPSLYMTPDEVSGKMPYVMEGGLISFGQIPKRSLISVKAQKNQVM